MTILPFYPAVTAAHEVTTPAYWFIFQGYKLLVRWDEQKAVIPFDSEIKEYVTAVRQHYLGYFAGDVPISCYAVEASPEDQPPEGMAFMDLRRLLGALPEQQLWLGGRAVQIIDWDRTHQFCGRCGIPNETITYERAKKCPQCGLTSYPRIAPAIIVRITREGENGREILLARSHRHPPGRFSVLAGFVEPGETLEECVRREIREEVGLEVQNIRYFGSQPWPFPNSLMIAFTCEHASGDIVLEEAEMAEADWYAAETLPAVPPPPTISRRLIDDFVGRDGVVQDW